MDAGEREARELLNRINRAEQVASVGMYSLLQTDPYYLASLRQVAEILERVQGARPRLATALSNMQAENRGTFCYKHDCCCGKGERNLMGGLTTDSLREAIRGDVIVNAQKGATRNG